MRSMIDLEYLGHDLGHLDEQPLPHLGAAVVQADRAVGIDMHQRPGLVHVRNVEGDAEFQREQAEPALEDRIGLVEGVDLGAPAIEVALLLHLGPAARQMVFVDLLAVGRLVPSLAVEIERAYVVGVAAEMVRDAVDRVLHDDHALRPAEAAEGGVGLPVGPAGIADSADMRQPVGIVDMGERAGDHAGRHVEAPAGIGRQHRVERQHAALIVEAHRVAIVEAVALAGGDHVDLARQAKFYRPAGLGGGQSGRAGDPRGVALLAAEAAAQAAHHRGHAIEVAAQNLGANMLHFGGMLRRGMHDQVAVLARQDEGDLAFEIEVLLPADAERRAQPVRRGLQRRHRGRRAAWSTAPAHRPVWPAPWRYRGSPRRARYRSPRARRRRGRHRAYRRRRAPSGWPANSTLVSANNGSFLPAPAMLLWPGMSPAANTPRRRERRPPARGRARAGGRPRRGSAPGRHAGCRAARRCRRYRAPGR